MGAHHSCSRMSTAVRAGEIKNLRVFLHEANADIDWASESSVQAHSAVNCLENADFHRRTAAGFGFTRRSATAAQRVCTGRIARKRTSVAFSAEPAADITAASIERRRALATRVLTGINPGTAYSLYAEKEAKDVAGGRAVSRASSVCSEDSTVPRSHDFDADDWLGHSRESPTRIAPYAKATCKRVNTNEMMCVLPATNNTKQVDVMLSICDILTGSPTSITDGSWTRKCAKTEISYSMADILNSNVDVCDRPVLEAHADLAKQLNETRITLAACEY